MKAKDPYSNEVHQVFKFNLRQFLDAKLSPDKLELEITMRLHPGPVWDKGFLDGLKSDFGEAMNPTLDRMTDELNKEIAVRMMLL